MSEEKASAQRTHLRRHVDLAPVDDADSEGVYCEALNYALGNERIRNIAVTGPYGSGKSSIIRTFEKRFAGRFKFLNISLACFKESPASGAESESQDRLVERSILQQMLYGADANTLPFSRFKRIATPTYPVLRSAGLVAWALLVYFCYGNWDKVAPVPEIVFSSVGAFSMYILGVGFLLGIPVVVIAEIYRAMFGLTISKVSLKNVEIETAKDSSDSILNRHLDEIIYFFQETNYDVVVIEDLDRFGSPEIFVKLREINKLVNDSRRTGRAIRFVYALKDSIFKDTERPKFFDYIIPVVPVINSANSLDKIKEWIDEGKLQSEIDEQFVRGVSLHLIDYRLIKNILNEFDVYRALIGADTLDLTKLLAMMVYKNAFPEDFEKLHQKQGALYDLCGKRLGLLAKEKSILRDYIGEQKRELEQVEHELVESVEELISSYVGHLMRYTSNQQVAGILVSGKGLPFSHFNTFEGFRDLIGNDNIRFTQAVNNSRAAVGVQKTFSQIEEEINPGRTFLERKERIELGAEERKASIRRQIREHERAIAELPRQSLGELVVENEEVLLEVLDSHQIRDMDLFSYLVKNGYIDDTFNLYISKFYEGRMSSSDRDFAIAVLNFGEPGPQHQIDHPREVCEMLRDGDFSSRSVLNVTLVDYLLETLGENKMRFRSVVRVLEEDFLAGEEFLQAYFSSGKRLGELVRMISAEWPGFAVASLASALGAEVVANVLKYVESDLVAARMNLGEKLTKFLSSSGNEVYASELEAPENFETLVALEVEFENLHSIVANEELLKFVHEHDRYELTVDNVILLLDRFPRESADTIFDPRRSNFTAISVNGSSFLGDRVRSDLKSYAQSILQRLECNDSEEVEYLRELLRSEQLSDEQKLWLLGQQRCEFESFEGLPEEFWGEILRQNKIAVSWLNVSHYLESKLADQAVLTAFIQNEGVVGALAGLEMGGLAEDAIENLSLFIVENEDLEIDEYRELSTRIPLTYDRFPIADADKQECLIRSEVVVLSGETFLESEDSPMIRSLLIETCFDAYLKNKEAYDLDLKTQSLLLQSDLAVRHKVTICEDIGFQSLADDSDLGGLVASVLAVKGLDISQFESSFVRVAILNATSIDDALLLLLKVLDSCARDYTMSVLKGLGHPYSEIAVFGKRPKLKLTPLNRRLAEGLKARGYVSSVKLEDNHVRVITLKSAD